MSVVSVQQGIEVWEPHLFWPARDFDHDVSVNEDSVQHCLVESDRGKSECEVTDVLMHLCLEGGCYSISRMVDGGCSLQKRNGPPKLDFVDFRLPLVENRSALPGRWDARIKCRCI